MNTGHQSDDSTEPIDDGEPDPIAPLEPENPVAQAHRRHGIAGAILAGGMIAIDQIMGRKPKEQPAAVQEFSGEPGDIDSNGISIAVDENTTVFSPAPHRRGTSSRTVRRRRRGGAQGS